MSGVAAGCWARERGQQEDDSTRLSFAAALTHTSFFSVVYYVVVCICTSVQAILLKARSKQSSNSAASAWRTAAASSFELVYSYSMFSHFALCMTVVLVATCCVCVGRAIIMVIIIMDRTRLASILSWRR